MKNSPTTIIIFGATGDLSKQKLLPALFDLYKNKYLPDQFKILGVSRTKYSDIEFQQVAKDAFEKKGHDCSDQSIKDFISRICYTSNDATEIMSYGTLATYLEESDKDFGVCSNKLFYLAVSPKIYDPIIKNLSESGMTTPCVHGEEGVDDIWTRVLVEKPFGTDLKHARELDETLNNTFQDSQVYRIDHYLAKETVQNILAFRFANSIFEPLWNKNHIESVSIKFYEKDLVTERGAFFDSVGLLRDIGQNHMLQMLALVAMEDPGILDHQAIRDSRAEVLDKVRPLSDDAGFLKRGQYEGYRDIEGVNVDTETETYFKMALKIENERWEGVPLTLEGGKALHEERMEVQIIFKEKRSCVCPTDDIHDHHKNTLTISIQPKHGISLRFWVKRPGFMYELDPKDLEFEYMGESYDDLPDAYERVLYDAIRGDQTLFTNASEVISEWEITGPIHKALAEVPLHVYPPGTPPDDIGI